MEVPYFDDDLRKRRRQINLGGNISHATHDSLIQEARLRRIQRTEMKRRQESATRIQSWWRGRRHAQHVRQQLRATFDQNVDNVTGLRCLVLIGKDEALLGRWASAMVANGSGAHPYYLCNQFLLDAT